MKIKINIRCGYSYSREHIEHSFEMDIPRDQVKILKENFDKMKNIPEKNFYSFFDYEMFCEDYYCSMYGCKSEAVTDGWCSDHNEDTWVKCPTCKRNMFTSTVKEDHEAGVQCLDCGMKEVKYEI